MAMRASKQLQLVGKIGDGITSPLRQNIIRTAKGYQPKKKCRETVKMNQHQIQLMGNQNTSQALRTLMKNVYDLQSSRRFEHLIPNNIRKAKAPPKISMKKEEVHVQKAVEGGVKHDLAVKELSPVVKEQLVVRTANTDKTMIERFVNDVMAFITTTMTVNLPGKRLLCGRIGGGVSSYGHHIEQQAQNQATLYALAREGLGKSSNLYTMRPARNWASFDTQRFCHTGATLGRSFGSIQPQRQLSTTIPRLAKSNSKDCKKKGGSLPCLKATGIVKDEKGKKANNKICEKFCMPCCPPARDPPDCVAVQKKRECTKFKAPRPAFSECKKDNIKAMKPCECLIEPLPPCKNQSGSKSKKGCQNS